MPSRKNNSEEAIRKVATELDFNILDKGWPDFLLYKKKKIIFLEVKNKSRLSKSQHKMHTVLKRLGLDVRVIRVPKTALENSGRGLRHRQRIKDFLSEPPNN